MKSLVIRSVSIVSIAAAFAVAAPAQVAGSIPYGAHRPVSGGNGSFVVRAGRGEILARVEVRRGSAVITYNEELLMRIASEDATKAELDRERLHPGRTPGEYRRNVDEVLDFLATRRQGDPLPEVVASLRWPIRCAFYCSQHQMCEDYEWIGFSD